jgi:hypothetical protein
MTGGGNAIEEVMRHSRSFGSGGFGRPYLKLAVHRDGIAIHNLTAKLLR